MGDRRRHLGAFGERIAAQRLERSGHHILARNARTRRGEIDLISEDAGTLVFVEVKTIRAGNSRGPAAPAHAVGARKQARVRMLAREWLASERPRGRFSAVRFDVVGVLIGPDGEPQEVEHIEAAF